MEMLRTIFTFYSSSFNTKQTKKHYINPNNYGDDLAVWLADEIKKLGAIIETENEFPGQEDSGWYVNFIHNKKSYCLIIGSRPDDNNKLEWVGWIERNPGFFGPFFGGRNKNVGREAFQLINKILSSSDKIINLRWHLKKDFDKGNEGSAGKELF